jgi:hypothetical protein
MSISNYNGKQPNNTAYIKNFVYGIPANLWKILSYTKIDGSVVSAITTASTNFENLYIQGDLFVDGSIINPSDINLKRNIAAIDKNITDKIMNLKPSSFSFKDDPTNKIHYGFIAQELEDEYPELIQNKPDYAYSKIKAINYLEIIPLLVDKIQIMQKEIDELKYKINIVTEK